MTILLADAGSTKTDWVKLTVGQKSAPLVETFSGPGISPVHNDSDSICSIMELAADKLGVSFERVRFYGSGIGSPDKARKIEDCIARKFDSPDIKADSDMAGAARAVLGNSPGIACIMGTGSNSCHYDGTAVDRKSASLGFFLDDEGGGVAFGRRILSDVFKGIAPQEIIDSFHNRYHLEVQDIVEHLYRRPAANTWIAGFVPFIVDNLDHPYMSRLVDSQISRFLNREFACYPEMELRQEGVGFAGSLAHLFADRLQSEFQNKGWKIRNITARPLSRLIDMELEKYGKPVFHDDV